MSVFTALKHLHILENLNLHISKHSRNQLFVLYRVGFKPVRNNIVNVFYENHISINFVQILYQCSMPTWSKQNLTIGSPERLIVHCGSCGVGTALLFREGDVVFDIEFSLIFC